MRSRDARPRALRIALGIAAWVVFLSAVYASCAPVARAYPGIQSQTLWRVFVPSRAMVPAVSAFPPR